METAIAASALPRKSNTRAANDATSLVFTPILRAYPSCGDAGKLSTQHICIGDRSIGVVRQRLCKMVPKSIPSSEGEKCLSHGGQCIGNEVPIGCIERMTRSHSTRSMRTANRDTSTVFYYAFFGLQEADRGLIDAVKILSGTRRGIGWNVKNAVRAGVGCSRIDVLNPAGTRRGGGRRSPCREPRPWLSGVGNAGQFISAGTFAASATLLAVGLIFDRIAAAVTRRALH